MLALGNGLITLYPAPELGGRILQFYLEDFSYFWVNPQRLEPALDFGRGPGNEYLNHGGLFLWPAPQGWGGQDQWPFPPIAFAGEGPHELSALAGGADRAAVRMRSAPDAYMGLCFEREVHVDRDSAKVRLALTMHNVDRKPRRWALWQLVQHDASDRFGDGPSPDLWACCPVNPSSRYPRGYRVMFGPDDHPSFKRDPRLGLVTIENHRRAGKIGVDSAGGWLAVVNRQTGHMFVERFTCFPNRAYPDDASVEFWVHGSGRITVNDQQIEYTDDPRSAPYYVESEVLSPLARLAPGDRYTFGVEWCAAKISPGRIVSACHEHAVVCRSLEARAENGRLRLGGELGVFQPGALSVAQYDERDRELHRAALGAQASPLEPLILDRLLQEKPLHVLPRTRSVAVWLETLTGEALRLSPPARVAGPRPVELA